VVDAITEVPVPVNEPINSFIPGSPERTALEERLKQLGVSGPSLL
jgi:1-pyrroline-5-carboxylate dehydrogenase